MSYRCLKGEQARQVEEVVGAATNSPFGPDIVLFVADRYLAHKADGVAGEFRVSRTEILEYLNYGISRAALRKLLMRFEEKHFVKLDGRYVGVAKSLTGTLTLPAPCTFTQPPKQEAIVDPDTREFKKTSAESQMPGTGVNGAAGSDSIMGSSGQNATWNPEEECALNCAVEVIASYVGNTKELVLFRLAGACAATPQSFLAAVCGVASALRSSLFVEDYVAEVRKICANKSSYPAANPKTFVRIHQAYIAAMTDSIRREQERKKAEEQIALGNWFLAELGKHMQAPAQAGAASAANASPAADCTSVDSATSIIPGVKTATAATTDPVCVAPEEAVPSASPEKAQASGDAACAHDEVKLAKIYQLPQPGDWFRAA